MSTRIVVKCYSQAIPGEPLKRRDEMANMICRYRFGRDFDAAQDHLQSSGQYAYDNNRCFFLVDSGRGDEEPAVSMYKWDGKEL